MSDPTRAPAGWYEDGYGGRRYWDGDAWTQYAAPVAETVPLTPLEPDATTTQVLATGDDNPTIPFVWGSRGSDAASPAYGDAVAPTTPGHGLAKRHLDLNRSARTTLHDSANL